MFDVKAKLARLSGLFLSLLLVLFSSQTLAVDASETGEVPIRLVGGHLVTLVDVSANGAHEEFSLLVDFEAPYTLALVQNAGQRLKLGPNSEDVKIQFTSGLILTVPAESIQGYNGPLNPDDIIKYHIAELDERKVAGAIGFELLKQYKVTIDANSGSMLLEEPQALENGVAALDGDLIVSPIREEEAQTYLPVQFTDGKRVEMVFGTNYHDTYIDFGRADKMGAPAGDVGPVKLVGEVERAELDLSRYMAFRPQAFFEEGAEETSTALISGTNLLRHFRVVLDWENRYATFTQTKSADFPHWDLAFFKARHANTAAAVSGYLDKYPEERFSKEAAQLLVDLLVAENASHDEIYKAVELVVNATEEMRRTVTAQEYIGKLAGVPDAVALLQKIGEMGLSYSSKAIDGFSAYDIHVQLGLIAQQSGELKKAWEHLLSATFGRPDDFRAVVALGKVYEEQGRYRRAYSRYKKVATYVPQDNPNDEFLPVPVLEACMDDAKAGMERIADKVPEKDK